ncbi:PREDICTED: uncharacterized protein LOC109329088 [Lupinus angustifolius]|uniref:uncharacterized protein LOC109329088 n=1 Tax=Lupinus angustifolius TaxID=3871 RepID=UPI00092F6824|nr:PREDICTED: uncharacterized protein LOC109329088 [Lupinus angustifolius]
MFNTNQLTSWEAFTKALLIRFGPSTFANPQAELFKLRQTTTVTEHQTRFERLSNQVVGLPPEMVLNCFLSGLNPEIARELALQQLFSVTHAIGMANLVERKINAAKTNPWWSTSATVPVTNNQNIATLTQPPTNQTPASLPIKRLTAAQMQTRRAQGLYYNCDEKYITGHRCKPQQFLLPLSEDPTDNYHNLEPLDNTPNLNYEQQVPADNEVIHFHLSDQAFQGKPSPKTLKFQGTILGHQVTVLVDTGSSHNVMQPRVAQFLQLPISPRPKFPVMVGNGERIYCTGLCKETPINLQQQLFTIPFYLLPIQGANVVLGIEC